MTVHHTLGAIALSLSAMLLGTVLRGQEIANKEAMAFSRIVHDPSSVAMAFSGKASPANVAWASFSNAAIVPMYKGKFDAELSYQSWAPSSPLSSSPISAGLSYNTGKVGITAGGSYISYAAYDIVDEGGTTTGSYAPNDLQLNAGIGFMLGKDISLGINARYLSSRITSEDAYSSLAADIFIAGRVALRGVGFHYTLGLANMGTGVKDASGVSYPLPSSVSAAGSVRAELAPKNFIRANLDADYFLSSSSLGAAIGVEYSYNDMLFLRGGYHYGSAGCAIPSFASLGIGASLYGVTVNASYILANELIGGTLCLGIGYAF